MMPKLKSKYRQIRTETVEVVKQTTPIVVDNWQDFHNTPGSVLRPNPVKIEPLPELKKAQVVAETKPIAEDIRKANSYFQFQREHPYFSQLGINSLTK